MIKPLQCIKCKKRTKHQPAQVDNIFVDPQDIKLTDQAVKHLAENKIVCGECKTDWCKSCKKPEYHLGYTCEEYRNYQSANRCGLCSNCIPSSERFCQECELKLPKKCDKKLKCGH